MENFSVSATEEEDEAATEEEEAIMAHDTM